MFELKKQSAFMQLVAPPIGVVPEDPLTQSIAGNLRSTLAVLQGVSDVSVALSTHGRLNWLLTNSKGHCSHANSDTDLFPGCNPSQIEPLEVRCQGRFLGNLLIYNDQPESSFRVWLENQLVQILRLLEMERQEKDLLDELCSSWECLQAVYNLSTEFHTLGSLEELLVRILDKAVSFEPGLQGVLWVKHGARFEPTAVRTTGSIQPKPADQGLAAQACQLNQALVLNEAEKIRHTRGLERELRRATAVALVPVVHSTSSIVLQVWREGDGQELDTQLLRLLKTLAVHASMLIENDQLKHEVSQHSSLQQEIAIGSKVQQALLLEDPPQNVKGISIGALTIASRQVDGDFYDFICQGDDCVDLLIGDVMGKGVAAALLAAVIRGQFQTARAHLTRLGNESALPNPHQIVQMVHSRTTPQLLDLESFVTLCYARIDRAQNRLDLTSCGHPKTLHFRNGPKSCSLIDNSNLPLGFSETETYTQVSTRFEPGDLFVFYSDGVLEAKNGSGDFFGIDRLIDVVTRHFELSPNALVDQIQESVAHFRGSEFPEDDFTCVVLRIDDHHPTIIEGERRLKIDSDLYHLARVRSLVRGLFPHSEQKNALVGQLELGLTEVVSNVCRYSYSGGSKNPILIQVNASRERVVFEVHHWGKEFHPSPGPVNLDLSKDNGFGLFLMDQIFDEVIYSHGTNGRQRIVLLKGLDSKGEKHV